MTKKTAMFMMLLALMVSSIFATPLFEGFEGTFPPTGWTSVMVADHDWTQEADAYAGSSAAGYAGTANAGEAILTSPRLDLTAGTADNLSFWYKAADWLGDQNELYVEYSSDGGTTWVEIAHLMNAEDYTQQSFDLEGQTQTDDAYIRFRAIDLYGYPVLVDNVVGPMLYGTNPIVDLQAVAISGNNSPTVNTVTDITLTVFNAGDVDATNFDVKLFDENDVELATLPVTGLASLASDDYMLSFTPTVAGAMNVYGAVVSTEDTDASNNETGMLALNVQGAGTAVVTIGDASETQYRTPYNLYYKSSLAQMIYPAADITAGGLLTAISFSASISSTDIPAGLPINIWIGETADATLTAFEASTNLTQVYQGTVDFAAGDADYMFTLDTPYAWGGNNLLVSVERPMDADYYSSSDVWYSTACPEGEVAYYQSDSTAPDPTMPPAATLATVKPDVQLYFMTSGLGSISGVVTDGTNPVAGVSLALDGTNFSAMSAADGTYSFPYVPADTYSIIATMHGYADSQVDGVVVTENNDTMQDVTMTMLPMVNVTGQVLASDTAAGIQASIELTGYENYMADTDAMGYFTIPVFAGHEYAGVATADGYNSASFTATVGTTDLDLGTITVTEIAFPVTNVVAEEVASDAVVTWNPAFQGGGGTGTGFAQGFENEFPPTGWNVQILNADDGAHFQQFGEVAYTPPVTPTEGSFQTGVQWAYTNQDEWLITNAFDCPGASNLTFDFYGHYGSTNADHYEVKVSTDGGTTWTVLWDASALPEGDNEYTAPVMIDLSMYAGQNITLAWHFYDGPTDDGLWYSTFIDNVVVGNATQRVQFAGNDFTHVSKATPSDVVTYNPGRKYKNPNEPVHPIVTSHDTRSFMDYTVYRLNFGDEADMNLWTELATITDTTYTDTDWSTLTAGTYEYAVVANYTNNVASDAAISNWLINGMMGSLAVTVTTNVGTVPVGAEVVITSQNMNPDGEYPVYTAMTDDMGVATFTDVWFSTYDLTASLDGFAAGTLTDIVVDGDVTAAVMLTEVMIPANTVVAAVNDTQTEVNLTWEAPGAGGTSEWIHKDSGENNDGIGLTSGGTFNVAVKFDAAELQDYNGMFLSRIKYWPNADGTYVLKVWAGDDGMTEVYSEPIAAPVIGEWNEVQMSAAVTVDATQALYIGYEVTHDAGNYVAGTDAGPHVAGGDMIMMDGETAWSELHVLASTLDYNWNIQGYVGWATTREISNHKVAVAPKATGEKVVYNLAQSGITNTSSTSRVDRPVTGYNVYRLNTGQEDTPGLWTTVGAFVTDLNYADDSWATVAPGFYRWAVRAVYTGDVEAPAAFSNELIKDMVGLLDGTVVDAVTNAPIADATVTVDGNSIQTDATGYYMFSLLEGVYTVECAAPGYVSQTQENVAVSGTQVSTVNFQMAQSAVVFEDGFESYTDFTLDFAPWTQIDNDGLATYGFTNTSFDNSGYTGSYMVFNPTTTTPPLETLVAYEGDKMAACFAAIPGDTGSENDDWLITPQIHVYDGGTLEFQVKSFTADYGLERYNLYISTTGNAMGDFTQINTGGYLEAPVDWTMESISLDMYAGQDIYFAIQCVTADAFIFLIDQFIVDSPNPTAEDVNTPVVTALQGNYPNPFNPTTTISYSVKEAGPVTIDVYNVRGQKVRTLVNEDVAAGNHTITWTGDDSNGKAVASGVYFYRMNSTNYNETKKMMLMK